MKQKLRIGTRKSQLAMAQTEIVMKAIKEKNADLEIELIPMSTIGDKILDKPLDDFGGKGAFVSEFEEAMLQKQIDIAVHSAKDMPMDLPEGLTIIGVSKREDVRDILITKKDKDVKDVQTVGTSSLRRQIQINELYPVEVTNLRGNVNTRLKKLENGDCDAIILAAAGLNRLGYLDNKELGYTYLNPDSFIPAAGQGIIAVEGRKEDYLIELLSDWNNEESQYMLETEREVLRLLNAGCNEAIGVYSKIEKDELELKIFACPGGKILKVVERAPVKMRLSLAKKMTEIIMKEYNKQ